MAQGTGTVCGIWHGPSATAHPLTVRKTNRYRWRSRSRSQRQPTCHISPLGVGRDQAGFRLPGRLPEAKRSTARTPLPISPVNSPTVSEPLSANQTTPHDPWKTRALGQGSGAPFFSQHPARKRGGTFPLGSQSSHVPAFARDRAHAEAVGWRYDLSGSGQSRRLGECAIHQRSR
jgi:hypothetical protein